jgi:hypothetical protein
MTEVADATEESAVPITDSDGIEEPKSGITDAEAPIVDAMGIPTKPRGDSGFFCMSAGGIGEFDADIVCDRTSEWCFTNHGFMPTGCVSLTSTCQYNPYSDGQCYSVFTWDASACVPGTLRCECLTVTCSSGYCVDEPDGGLTVSCGSCYGAPPARLERLS